MDNIDIGIPMISRDLKFLPAVLGTIEKALEHAKIKEKTRIHIVVKNSERFILERVVSMATKLNFIFTVGQDYDNSGQRHNIVKIAEKRNFIVQRAKNNSRDGVLFIDSDILVNGDTITRLITACTDHGADVCAAAYHPTWAASAMIAVGTQENPVLKSVYELDSKQHCVPMLASGAGCTLLKKSAFHIKFEDMKDKKTEVHGEDIGFMANANKAGLCMRVLTAYHVTHLAAASDALRNLKLEF